MSSVDGEEVVMILRACLAANKQALSMRELQSNLLKNIMFNFNIKIVFKKNLKMTIVR